MIFRTLVLGAFSVGVLPAQATNWPMIQTAHERQTFIYPNSVDPGKSGPDTPMLLFVKDARGVPIYKVECHNGEYNDASEIVFSGDFHCAMFSIKHTKLLSGNLLAANTRFEQSTDYTNRGRMVKGHLREPCASSPAYGRVRRIQLRGMVVTIQFIDLVWSASRREDDPQFKRLTVDLSVVPDTSSRTAEAAPVPDDRDSLGRDLCG